MIIPNIEVNGSKDKEMAANEEHVKNGGNLLKMAYMPNHKKNLKASLNQKNSREWTKHKSQRGGGH